MAKSTTPVLQNIKVTVVIPNWNGQHWLGNCLTSLKKQSYKQFNTVIVDNGSTDDSVKWVEKNFPDIEVIRLSENTGFANAVNVGIEKAKTPYVALLNSDTAVFPDWLKCLVDRMDSSAENVGALNSLMVQMDDQTLVDDAGDSFSLYGLASKNGHGEPAKRHQTEVEVVSPSGGASLYRKKFLEETGGFDPAFFAYLEDVDLGLRGRLHGYKYLLVPSARVLHKGHGSNLDSAIYSKLTIRNRLFLLTKNFPTKLLFKHFLKLIYGQLYLFLRHRRHPVAVLGGLAAYFANLPSLIRWRSRIKSSQKVSTDAFELMLTRDKPNPTLSEWIAIAVKRRLKN